MLCTSLYSLKIFFFLFYNYYNIKYVISNINIKTIIYIKALVKFVLISLLFCSVISGFFFQDLLIGFGFDKLFNSIYIISFNEINFFEFLPIFIKLLSLIFTFLGFFLSFFVYNYI